MTREQKWIHAELAIALAASRSTNARLAKHFKARAETLRRILQLVEKAQP